MGVAYNPPTLEREGENSQRGEGRGYDGESRKDESAGGVCGQAVKIPIKCGECGTLLAKYLPPSVKHPFGAFEIIAKHHREKHETVFSIPAPVVISGT